MYIYIYICIYVCMCIFIYFCPSVYLYIYQFIPTAIHLYIYLSNSHICFIELTHARHDHWRPAAQRRADKVAHEPPVRVHPG